MNELIDKLARQAFGSTIDADPILVYEAEKFVVLIIKECAEVAHCNFHVSGIPLGIILKEHFGIKE